MRQHYLTLDSDGIVEGSYFGYPPSSGNFVVIALKDFTNPLELYVDGANGLMPRPRIDNPVFNSGVLTLPPVPEGTLIQVIDLVSDEVLFEVKSEEDYLTPTEVSFLDSGSYCIMLTPPLPYMPTELRISV